MLQKKKYPYLSDYFQMRDKCVLQKEVQSTKEAVITQGFTTKMYWIFITLQAANPK